MIQRYFHKKCILIMFGYMKKTKYEGNQNNMRFRKSGIQIKTFRPFIIIALFVFVAGGYSGSGTPLQAFNIPLKKVAVSRFDILETTLTTFDSIMRTVTSEKSKLPAMTGKKSL